MTELNAVITALVEHAELLRTPGICGKEEFAERWKRAALLDDLATVLTKALAAISQPINIHPGSDTTDAGCNEIKP